MLEDHRRRGVAHGPVTGREAALRVRGRTLGRACERAVGLVGRHDLRVVDATDQRVHVQAGDPCECRAQVLVLVEQARGRELQQLESAQGALTQRGIELAGRDDRAAGACRGRHARLSLEAVGHAEALAEPVLRREQAVRGVAARLVGLGGLAQPDQDESPLDLVAEAPAQPSVSGTGGIGPGAGGVREVDGRDCSHNHEDTQRVSP